MSGIEYEINGNPFSCSEFKDIFDLKYFTESLQEHVDIVEALPPHLAKIEPTTKAPISWSKVTILSFEILLLQSTDY